MAINFPNSPINGTTYTYQGVIYIWKDTGGGTGLWQVTGPGTYGVATGIEVDAGTDTVKYLSPKAIEDSSYAKESYVDALVDALFEATHPVGTVILRANDVDPNTTLSGTWVSRGTSHSLQAVGLGNGAGGVVGSNDVAVPIPQHNHTASFSGNYVGNHSHGASFSGNALPAHAHSQKTSHTGLGGVYSDVWGSGGTSPATWGTSSVSAGTPTGSVSVGGGGAHTPSGTVTVNNKGTSGATMDVSGAVFKVVAWERTA